MHIRLCAAALLACTSPAAAYWECYPLRLAPVRSGPALHHAHFVARHATKRPTVRHHPHHRRICHVHYHCVWIDDGGPAGDSDFGGGDAGGYGDFGGGDSEGFAGGAPSGGGGGGAAGFPMVPPIVPPIFTPCPYPLTPPPGEYTPTPPPIAQVPELQTWAMFGIGFAFLFGLGRKHASKDRVLTNK